MCDEAMCEREMLLRKEYNITKARRCDIECCPEDKCNDGKFPVVNLAEVSEDMSRGEVPFISCLFVITSALVAVILRNN